MAYGIARDLLSGHHAVLRSDLVTLGDTHLQRAKHAIALLPDEARIAFLPLVIVRPLFDQARMAEYDMPLRLPSPLALLWRMIRFKI